MHMAIVTSRVATWEQNKSCVNFKLEYLSKHIHQGEQSCDGDPDDDLLVLVDLVPELGQAALEVVHVLRALRVHGALASLVSSHNSI